MPISLHGGGFLVQWIGIDDERAIEPALRGGHIANLLNGPGAEALDFATGPTGVMRLFDSADVGDDLRNDSEVLRLRPGKHRMRAAYFESPGIMMVVREISWI